MADKEFKGEEKGRFPSLLLVGVAFAVAVNVAAFIADTEFGIPVLILTVICVLAALAFRFIAGGSRSGGGSDSDSESNFPRQEARFERPLGDTPEAHDELSVHDIPVDAPERHRSEEVAEGQERVFRGPVQ
jgi:hypothetical protein